MRTGVQSSGAWAIAAVILGWLGAPAPAQSGRDVREPGSDAFALGTMRLNADELARHADAGSGGRWTLATPAGAFELETTRSARRPSGVALSGRVLAPGAGTFSVTLEGGFVSGGLWTESGAWGLRPVAASSGAPRAEFVAVPAADVVRCMPAPNSASQPWRHLESYDPAVGRGASPVARVGDGPQPARMGAPGATTAAATCPCDDDPGTIDVLVVYTALARDAAGGAAALQARVQDVMDSTTAAFTASGIGDVTMALAGFEEIAYDEVSPNWIDHLIRVTEAADGFMDGVHASRDAAAADAVMLIVDDARFTGGSAWWAIWDQALAFSVLNWRAAGGGILTGAHEFGHNLGCAHDRANDASAPFSYAWGHKYTSGPTEYGDIMSIGPDVYLATYSDPEIIGPGGVATGVAIDQPLEAHTAYQIEHTAWTLANYRRSARTQDCNNNSIDDATDIASLASLDINLDGIPDECQAIVRADIQSPATGAGETWSAPRHDLAEAVDLAHLKCSKIREIWAADGAYLPDHGSGDPWQRFDLRTGLALRGGFQGISHPSGGELTAAEADPYTYLTVLSGDIGVPGDASDNAYSVLVAQNAATTAVVDGFTIEGGNSFGDGGGLWMTASSPTVLRSTFRGNHADFNGGATIALDGSAPYYGACVFESNTAGGSGGAAAAYGASAPTFVRILFKANTAGFIGGAISITDGTLRVDSASFREGEAISYGGGIDLWNSDALIGNSRFFDNTAGIDGGGISFGGGTECTVNACTFAINDADGRGGGISFSASDLTVLNSILWDNTSSNTGQNAQVWRWSGTTTIHRSCVDGWTGSLGGVGNTGADPLLADAPAGDFTLLAGSPVIDAGDSTVLPADDFDLDADGDFAERVPFDLDLLPRLVNDPATSDTGVAIGGLVVDMGAFEYQPPACPADLTGEGDVNINDFFAFLTLYQAMDPRADFAPGGGINVNDFFAFLAAYQAGC